MEIGRRKRIQEAWRDDAELRLNVLNSHAQVLAQISEAVANCFARGGKAMIFGNGGSASQAQHMAAELVGRYRKQRVGLPALALTADSVVLTAIANDYGYDCVFSRQIEALASRSDIAIAISTSGKSPNVVRAIKCARAKGLPVIALAGPAGMATPVDFEISVPSSDPALVQELHLASLHIICELVEDQISAGANRPNSPAPRKTFECIELMGIRERARERAETVVWTNGCFDILHAGHLRSLRQAKAFGDILMVGINTDESVRRLKGSGRPLVPLAQRMELVAGLDCVDFVTPFDETTPELLLAQLKPDIHCKGSDYAPPVGKPVAELPTVLSYGGRVEYIPMVADLSSTELLRRIRNAE